MWCRVTKEVNERSDESVLRWFDHTERDGGIIAEREWQVECVGSPPVG